MQLDVSLAGFIVGVVVGLTGMGGGALMTPVLVIGFGIQPLTAVSSDLVAAFVMKPIGGGIHWRRRTVHMGLVGWLAAGSIPGAFGGAYLISHVGGDVDATLQTVLGVVLVLAGLSMVLRGLLGTARDVTDATTTTRVRVVPTLLIGIAGGLVVGVTSVGSGSLMIVALMFLYPQLSTRELVGTDLVQAVPLVGAAALGHLLWGNLEFGLTTSLLLGSIPGVIIGAVVSSRANDSFIRPALVAVLVLSGAKLLDASNEVLGLLVGLTVVATLPFAVRAVRRQLSHSPVPEPSGAAEPGI